MTLLLLLTSTVPSPPSPTAGTYSWRVRATDEHGMASEWSSADTFTVTLSGSLPVVTLAPLATSTTTTPTSTWSVYDLDGDAQTHYQVQTASDAGFTADVVESGIVASTNMHHSHAALATGTWYRRVRVCTASTDWSEWDSDSFAIVAATAQTDAWEIWRDASGTPAQISATTYPTSAPVVTCRPNAPSSFSFMVNNFDGLGAGITSDDDILLYLKDSLTGNRIEFRGLVTEWEVGRFLSVTCQDIGYQFDRWGVTIERDNATLGEVIKAMVENPTGSAATGITTHIEEPEDPETAGQPIMMEDFEGQGRTVASWLADFCKATGYRWQICSVGGAWHFYFWNPTTAPTMAATAKNNIDYADESSAQWLILNEVKKRDSRASYANRVKYWARYEPLQPVGVRTWDEVWTEAATLWAGYTGSTVAAVDTYVNTGTKSIMFEKTFASEALVNRTMDFGYCLVPAAYKDFGNQYIQSIRYNFQVWRAYDDDWGMEPDDWTAIYPAYGGTWGSRWMTCILFSGAQRGPYNNSRTGPNGFLCSYMPCGPIQDAYSTYDNWRPMAIGTHTTMGGSQSVIDTTNFDANNVQAIAFRLHHPATTYPDWYVTSGHEVKFRLYIDNLRLSYIGQPKITTASYGQGYVETAEVTAGTEVPIECELGNAGLSQAEARKMATLWLARKSANQVFVNGGLTDRGVFDGLQFAGVRNVPLRSRMTVATAEPTIAATYDVAQVDYKPGETGWHTEVQLGDTPADFIAALEGVKHGLANIVSDGQQT